MIAVLLLLSLQQASSRDADVRELTRLETVWNDAHKGGDADALDDLWSAELQVAVPRMPVMTKYEALSFARSGRMKFDRYQTTDLLYRVSENTGIVTGRLQRTRTVDGQQVDDDWQFTKVYLREGGVWKVVRFHASERPPPS